MTLGHHTGRGLKAALPLSLTIEPLPGNKDYTVVVKCHIVDDATSAAVKQLIKTIEETHHSIHIEVDQVYPARSTGLFMRLPHSIFLSLETLSGVELLFEDVQDPVPVRTFAVSDNLPLRPTLYQENVPPSQDHPGTGTKTKEM